MKMFRVTCFLFVGAFLAMPTMAQKPAVQPLSTAGTISPGELTPTPEMWFYQQYRQEYQNPKELIRNRAVFRAEQREQRIVARKWLGFSAARPWASGDPWNAPVWNSSHFYYPRQWGWYGAPGIVAHHDGSTTWAY